VGADVALDGNQDVARAIRDLTDGAGVDLAIEASGSAAALDRALDSLAFGGTCVVCSWYGTKPVQLTLGGAFHRRRLRIVSSQVSTIDAALQPRWTHARRLSLARDLLPRLELSSLVSHRLPIERAAEAYALVDQQPEQTVQVVLTYT
jgi:threonine dehydrogenase-like Zn-dependent dehydrogenase